MFIHNIYPHKSALGTETECIIVQLHPQALKRFLSMTYKTFLSLCSLCLEAAQNNFCDPFCFQAVKPGSITNGFSVEYKTEYLVTNLLIFKASNPVLQDGS